MPAKMRLALLTGSILALSGAAYLGVALALSPAARQALLAPPGQPRNASLVPATELPQTQPDLFGMLVAKQDNSLILRPITKGPNDANNPLVEVVVTAQTKVYIDTTSEQTSPIVNGSIQQTVETFDAGRMVISDTVVAWGSWRGHRLTAEVVVDERNH
jgi:hypothetical protein